MRIGHYHLTTIETGEFALDGGAMFGVVPKTLWQRELPADDRNRVRLALRALLLEEVDGPARILIDTGVGEKWPAKLADVFGVDHTRLSLEAGLATRGLTPGDITHVLLTHLHFDHAGGATIRRDGELVPAFENARYFVQRRNLEWAQAPSERDRASYREENFEPLLRCGVLELLDGAGTWMDGIDLVLSHGHTEAMQLPVISGPEAKLVYCADLIPTAAHVRAPWVMGYDNHPVVTVEEKNELLARGCREGWLFFFEHDPEGPAATIRSTEKGFAIDRRMTL